MRINLKKLLCDYTTEIINDVSYEFKHNNLEGYCTETEEKLIEEETELKFILEVVYNELINRAVLNNKSNTEIDLQTMIYTLKRFKVKCREKIKDIIDDLEDRYTAIDELYDVIDKLELMIIERFNDNSKVYLNIETVSKIGRSGIIVLKGEEIFFANEVAKNMFKLGDYKSDKIRFESMFELLETVGVQGEKLYDNMYEGRVSQSDNSKDKKWIEFRVSDFIFKELGMKLVLASDITYRKEIDEKLKESEAKYKTLLEVMPDPMYVYNDSGIIYANNEAIRLFGYDDFKDVEHKKLNQIWKVTQGSQSTYQQKMDMLKRTGKIRGLEKNCIRNTDGKSLEIETTSSAYKVGDEEFVINITRDIEEKNKIIKLREGVKEKSLKLLEAKKYDELKNEFLANISHEFKTPINIIMTSMKLLNTLTEHDQLNKENLKRYTYLSKQNCYRLIKLVDNILDITKIDAGVMGVNYQRENVVEFVEKVTDSVREYIASKELTLIFDTDEEEKEILIDMTIVERVLLNLLSNAAKYTNSGGEIKVNVLSDEKDVIIEVIDNGIGIPKNKQKTIFDRFVQVDKTLIRNKEGSGIGLSLVKELTTVHRGSVELRSEEGVGSKFTIRIPMNDEVINKRYSQQTYSVEKIRTLIESIDIQFSDIYSQW